MLDNSKLLQHKDKIEKQTGKKLELPSLDTLYERWVFSQFQMLHAQRPGGEPLRIADILALFEINNVPYYDRSTALRFLSTLDGTYMEWMEKKRKKDEKRSSRKR